MKAREERPYRFRPMGKRGVNREGPVGGGEKGRERPTKESGQGNASERDGGRKRRAKEG
jgi:hypothetical protein